MKGADSELPGAILTPGTSTTEWVLSAMMVPVAVGSGTQQTPPVKSAGTIRLHHPPSNQSCKVCVSQWPKIDLPHPCLRACAGLLRVFDELDRNARHRNATAWRGCEIAVRKLLREKHGKHLSLYLPISCRSRAI